MMTESADVPATPESSATPATQPEAEPAVATVVPSPPRQSRRHSGPILPPPPPNSPYAFPPTYEEAMASKALEEGNVTPEVRAYLDRRTRTLGPEDRSPEVPRERLSNRIFVRKRVFIFRACLYAFILVLVIAAIVISVIKADSHMEDSQHTTPSPARNSTTPHPT